MGKCTLMHKSIEVADIVIDTDTSAISSLDTVYSKEHLPLGVVYTQHHKEVIDRRALNSWWLKRSIPASRTGLEEALETLNLDDAAMLLEKGCGMSLSDHYWIRPEGTQAAWENVNFFQNTFSEDIGDILLGERLNRNVDFNAPDNTSDGMLMKRWKIIDGKRCLLKAGENPFYQQPFNEVIASCIMDRLDIPHVSYSLVWINELPYSVCEDFVTTETELVSAYRVMQTRYPRNDESDYQHYVNICKENGLQDIVHSIDTMLVLDYLIANEDRHFNNFGILRNPETLQWISAAPVFDNGTSLSYNRTFDKIFVPTDCKPFKKKWGEQLKLISSFDWVDFSKLSGIEEELLEIMSGTKAEDCLGKGRSSDIAQLVMNKISALERMALKATPQLTVTKPTIQKDL